MFTNESIKHKITTVYVVMTNTVKWSFALALFFPVSLMAGMCMTAHAFGVRGAGKAAVKVIHYYVDELVRPYTYAQVRAMLFTD